MGAKHRDISANAGPRVTLADKDARRHERHSRGFSSDGGGDYHRFQSFLLSERLLLPSTHPEQITARDVETAYRSLLTLTTQALEEHGPSDSRFISLLNRSRVAESFRSRR